MAKDKNIGGRYGGQIHRYTSVQRSDIAQRRLAAQRLTGAPFADATEVVRAQGAVQAQDYGGAKWALALRCPDATDSVVEQAITDGRIVRTHVLRPTWHFVDPSDIRWLLRLTAQRVIARMAPYSRQLELDADTFRRSNAAVTRALRDGRQVTRKELGDVLKRERIRTETPRLAHLLMRAELDGIVCSGARQGKEFTYALLEECVAPARSLDGDEALLELTRRYFSTRGPATPRDFAWWSGLTTADAKRGVQMAGSELHHEEIDGTSYWFTESAAPSANLSPIAHLLPNYDEYFIGYRDRSAIGQRVKASKSANTSALTAHVLEVDGQIVGGWKRTVKRTAAVIDLYPIVRLSASERDAVLVAAARHGEFLGLPVEPRWAKTSRAARASK